jgi:hypothetical protein
MLWYKSWRQTRWRFFIGLALLMLSAFGAVIAYPRVVQLLPLVPAVDAGGVIGRRISEAAELARSYRGYVWSQWLRQSMTAMFTPFAVPLGTGGLLSQGAKTARCLPYRRLRGRSIAIGGAAVGVLYAIGGGALGPAAIDFQQCDEAAREFGRRWLDMRPPQLPMTSLGLVPS